MAVSAVVSISAQVNTPAMLVLQDLTYTAIETGDVGNSITIEYTDPGAPDSPISVSVIGSAISVSLETDGGSDLISTADDVKAAIDGDTDAHALVLVAVSGTGSDVQTAIGPTALAGGGNSSPYNAPIVAQVELSNSGGSDVTLKTLQPRVGDNTGVALGSWGPKIQPVVIPASGSVIASFPVVPFSPQVLGPSTEPSTYLIGCDIYTSDGQSVSATPAVLTVLPLLQS